MARKIRRNSSGKKAAAEKLLRELQNAKKSEDAPKGLDDLIKSIQNEAKQEEKKKKEINAIVKQVTDNQKKKQRAKTEDIDPRILELLGLEGYEAELDYDDYSTLLKEYLVKNQMGGNKEEKEGDTNLLKEELKRARKSKGSFKVKSKKVKATNFVGKKQQKGRSSTQRKPQTDKLLPSSTSASASESVKADLQEDVQEKLVPISKSLSNIESNLQKLLKVNQDKLELEKETARKLAAKEETEGFREKEAKLEAKDKKKGEKIEKELKPVKGIFDMIGDFFKNVLLGGAVNLILDIVQNPGKYLKPIIDFGNQIIDFVNKIITFINDVVLFPINTYINLINSAFNELEFAMKQIQKVIPIIQVPKFPDIPNIKLPTIDPIKYPQWMQQQEGGGEVIDIKNLSLFDGGAIDKMTGMTIKGMGKDTQLIAAQPGEIMMSQKYS